MGKQNRETNRTKSPNTQTIKLPAGFFEEIEKLSIKIERNPWTEVEKQMLIEMAKRKISLATMYKVLKKYGNSHCTKHIREFLISKNLYTKRKSN